MAPPWWRRQAGPSLGAWARRVVALDLRSLGVMRLALGTVLVADLIDRARWAAAHYSDLGVLPRALERQVALAAHWSLLDLSGTPLFCVAFFGVAVVVALLFTVGWHTRVATPVCWLMLTSIQNRNPFIAYSSDDLLRLFLFWSIFLPVGGCFSLDARAGRQSSSASTPASTAFVFQVLYFFCFLLVHKLRGHSWLDGEAVADALKVLQYRRTAGAWLATRHSISVALTYAVLVAQIVTPVLLLLPTRSGWTRWAAIAVTGFTQAGFGLSMRLGLFPFTTIAFMLALVPEQAWMRVGVAVPQSPVANPTTLVEHMRKALVSAAVIVSTFLAGAWNLSEAGATFVVAGKERPLSETAAGLVARALRLDQRWAMFSPNPETRDGWFVFAARTAQGRWLDVLRVLWGDRTERPVSWSLPASVAETMGPHRWAMSFLDASLQPKVPELEGLGRYACRAWNSESGHDRVVSVAVVFMAFDHSPSGSITTPEGRLLWKGDCLESLEVAPAKDEHGNAEQTP